MTLIDTLGEAIFFGASDIVVSEKDNMKPTKYKYELQIKEEDVKNIIKGLKERDIHINYIKE